MASAATTSSRGAAADMEKAAISLAETLARLAAATIFELRGEWRRQHRAPPPMRLSRDLLMRGITYTDTWVRATDGWKISDRKHHLVWMTETKPIEGAQVH